MLGKPFRSLLRFFDELNGTKKIVFFSVIILICVAALFVAIYIQFFYQYAETDPFFTGLVSSEKTQEEITNLKNSFGEIFKNSLSVNEEQKDSVDSSIVQTAYQVKNEDDSFYTIDVNVPAIKLNTQVAADLNAEFKNEFYQNALSYMVQTTQHIYYTVTYQAFYRDNYLSLVIKSSLKEGNNAESVVVRAIVYDTTTNQLVPINTLLEHVGITAKKAQNAIDKEIKSADTRTKTLAAEFGEMFSRNIGGEEYLVENAKNYFLTDKGNLYIVYTYGGEVTTNELDIIIL